MSLSEKETELLSRLAADRKTIFSLPDAEKRWQGSTPVRLALHRMESKGWLQRLDQGVYLIIPLEAGIERSWTESPLVIASYLIEPAAIGYWSALHYWQMTEQIPRTTFVQSTKWKRATTIQGMRFRFVSLKPERFFGIVERSINGQVFSITDREKTLIDCASRPDMSGGLGQLSQALRAAHHEVNWDRFEAYLERWDGGTVVKRLGYLVDTLGLAIPDRKERLKRWKQLLSEGISPLEPGARADGPTVTEWRVQVNVPGLRPDELR